MLKLRSPTYIVIHHTSSRKSIEDIYDLHVTKNKWAGIGYHFVIAKNGKIISADALGINLTQKMVKGLNLITIGNEKYLIVTVNNDKSELYKINNE